MGLYDPPSANNSTKNRFDMDFPKWNVKPQKGTGAWKGTYGFEIPSGIGPYDSSYPTMWVQGPEDMNPSKAAYLRRVMDTFRLGELKQGYGERQRMMEGLDAGELAANEKQWGDWRSAELAKAHATGLVSNQTLNRQALGVQQEQLAAQQIRDRQKMRLAGGLEGYLKMLERVNTSGPDVGMLSGIAEKQGLGGVYPGGAVLKDIIGSGFFS